MEVRKNKIETRKTGRAFSAGNHVNPDCVWILCHGYGQHAQYFLEKFSVLDDGKTLLIAPEGLHRFYTKGFSGRVGASWMTKEDREDDIEDYVSWLSLVVRELIPEVFTGKLILFGFSQGGATVCRWLERAGIQADHLVLYASAFPHDVVPSGSLSRYLSGKIVYALGKQDEFIGSEEKESHLQLLRSVGKPVTVIDFDGTHEILPDVLRSIRKSIES